VATSPTCGSATSDIVEIEVTPETTIVTQPSTTSQIDCIGTTFTPLSVTATGTSTLTYQWFSNSSATNIGGTAISGANSSTFTPPSITSGTLYYYVEISGGCGLAVSNASGAITVNPSTTIDSENLNSQAICDGGSFNPISVTASGTGTLHYQWYTNTSASTSGASPVGTDSPSYTPSAAVTGTNYYYVIVSSDCGSSIASNFSGAQTVQEITAISIQPDNSDDVECYGDGFNEISVSATGSGLTYQWYSNSSPITTGGTMVSGATLPNFTPPSVTLGSTYYYVVVTGNCGTETSTISGEYLVTPPITTITADPDPTPYSACLGVSFSPLSVNAIGEGAVTYQWYSNTSATNTGGTAIALATNSTFTPPSDTEGIIYYYATANSDCGTVPTAISGSYTVTPLTSIDSENLSPQTICEGETFDPISVVADGTNPIEFQWYSNSTNSNSGGTLISGANSEFFTPPTTSPGTSTYYYVIVSSFCGIDITSNVSGAMLVNANTSIDTNLNTTAPPIVCEGGSFPALSVTASGTGTLSYQWY
ncbi:Ig-like domain-containing protein, partial [Algoriphagus chordae]|uniref:Ig-like domain-containing protein n=1 Tax=Algoriphagus chordae TaxID=237019 RepID=UPI001314B75D